MFDYRLMVEPSHNQLFIRPGKYGLEIYASNPRQWNSESLSMVIPWSDLAPPPKTKAEIAEEIAANVLDYWDKQVPDKDWQRRNNSNESWTKACLAAEQWKDAPE